MEWKPFLLFDVKELNTEANATNSGLSDLLASPGYIVISKIHTGGTVQSSYKESEENPNVLRTFVHGIAFVPLLGYGLNMPGLDSPWSVPATVLNAFYSCAQSFETGHLVRWGGGQRNQL